MATRAKVIRNFFKKFFDLDISGMSEVSVLRDVFKKKYDIDVAGNSVVAILQNVIEAVDELPGGGEAQGRLVVTVNEPIGDIELYNDDGCYVTPPGFNSGLTVTFDGVPLTEQQMWQGLRMEVLGLVDGKLAVDCDATSVTYTTVFTYEGENCIVTVTQNITTSLDG